MATLLRTLDDFLALDLQAHQDNGATKEHIVVGLVPPIADPMRAANGRVATAMGDHTADLFESMPPGSTSGPDRLTGCGPALVPEESWQAIKFINNDEDPDRNSTKDIMLAIVKLIRGERETNVGKKIDMHVVSFTILESLNMDPQENHRKNTFDVLSHVLTKWGVTMVDILSLITNMD